MRLSRAVPFLAATLLAATLGGPGPASAGTTTDQILAPCASAIFSTAAVCALPCAASASATLLT